MKRIFLIVVLFVQTSSYAQDTTATASDFQTMKKNTVYFELAGNALAYSVNYDRLLTPNIACRAGLSVLPLIFPDAHSILFAFPISVSYLLNFAGTPSYIEAGIGITPTLSIFSGYYLPPPMGLLDARPQIDMVLVPMLGYRLQPKEEGFTFRILYSPHIPLDAYYHSSPSIKPLNYWCGVSLGHTF